jgi:hypothetical protein
VCEARCDFFGALPQIGFSPIPESTGRPIVSAVDTRVISEAVARSERKAGELKQAAVTTCNTKTMPTGKAHDEVMSRPLKLVLLFKRYS